MHLLLYSIFSDSNVWILNCGKLRLKKNKKNKKLYVVGKMKKAMPFEEFKNKSKGSTFGREKIQ